MQDILLDPQYNKELLNNVMVDLVVKFIVTRSQRVRVNVKLQVYIDFVVVFLDKY